MRTRIAAALLALGAAGGCKGGAKVNEVQSDAVHNAQQTATGAPLTDPGIVVLLDHVHGSEITAAQAALAKLQDPEVRAFANAMVTDHQEMRTRLEALPVKGEQARQPPSQWATMDAVSKAGAQLLNTMPSGPAFDRAYMALQVADHSTALDSLRVWQGPAQNGSLKQYIVGSIPRVQDHLQRAQEIVSRLGGGTPSGPVPPPPPDTAWYKQTPTPRPDSAHKPPPGPTDTVKKS
jgi:putative membrane protein